MSGCFIVAFVFGFVGIVVIVLSGGKLKPSK